MPMKKVEIDSCVKSGTCDSCNIKNVEIVEYYYNGTPVLGLCHDCDINQSDEDNADAIVKNAKTYGVGWPD